MKTFNRDHLPQKIEYLGQNYFLNINITHSLKENNTLLKTISATLKKEGRKAVLVKCMHKNLRGKKDLHGNPYQATEWIFTTPIPETRK